MHRLNMSDEFLSSEKIIGKTVHSIEEAKFVQKENPTMSDWVLIENQLQKMILSPCIIR